MPEGKYGKQRRTASRRIARAQSAANVDDTDRWCPPPQYDCEPGSGTIPIPMSATARILQRLEYDGPRLVFYSISLQCRRVDGSWEDAARIDCAHCTVHIHRPGSPKPIQIRTITRPEDVGETYDSSYANILDNWEDYERQWNGGRKRS